MIDWGDLLAVLGVLLLVVAAWWFGGWPGLVALAGILLLLVAVARMVAIKVGRP